MKNFALKILIVCLFVLGVFSCIFSVFEWNQTNYLATMPFKRSLIEQSSAKIVVAGGSNVYFGLNSNLIKESIPSHNPVNLGLNLAFGIRPIFLLLEPNIHASDIVVLSLEHSYYAADVFGDRCRSAEMLVFDQGLGKYYDWRQWLHSIPCIPYLSQGFVSNHFFPPKVYRGYEAATNNSFGDNYNHQGIQTVWKFSLNKIHVIPQEVVPEVLEYLKKIREMVHKKNAKMFIVWPPIPQEVYLAHQKKFLRLAKDLENELGAEAILGSQEEYTYPINDFFDNEYHLMFAAKDKWTSKWLEKLKARVSHAL
jgi:hypothetical protein